MSKEMAILPSLTYSLRGQSGVGINGDGPALYNVHEVRAWMSPAGDLSVWARGRMLRRDGQPGPSRGREVDHYAPQPAWLRQIVADAIRRLDPGSNGSLAKEANNG